MLGKKAQQYLKREAVSSEASLLAFEYLKYLKNNHPESETLRDLAEDLQLDDEKMIDEAEKLIKKALKGLKW